VFITNQRSTLIKRCDHKRILQGKKGI